MLPIVLPEEDVRRLIDKLEKDPGTKLNIDLEGLRVWDEDEEIVLEFNVEEFRRYCLLNGLDDIGLTLQNEDAINRFETKS